MQVSLQYAQEHLSELISAVNRGEDVEIAQPDNDAIKLLHVVRPGQPDSNNERRFGAWDAFYLDDSTGQTPHRGLERKNLFNAGASLPGRLPTDEEWDAMDKEMADEMLNGPIFPPEP